MKPAKQPSDNHSNCATNVYKVSWCLTQVPEQPGRTQAKSQHSHNLVAHNHNGPRTTAQEAPHLTQRFGVTCPKLALVCFSNDPRLADISLTCYPA